LPSQHDLRSQAKYVAPGQHGQGHARALRSSAAVRSTSPAPCLEAALGRGNRIIHVSNENLLPAKRMNRALDAIQRKPSGGKAASGALIPLTSAEIMAPSQAVHKLGGFKEFMLSDLQRCRLVWTPIDSDVS
jgi:hypothetical protein